MRASINIGIALCVLSTGCMQWAKPVHSKRFQAMEPSVRAESLKDHLDNAQTGPMSQRVLVDIAESYLEQTRELALRSAKDGKSPDPYTVAYLAEQAASTYAVLADTYPDWPPRPQALWYLGLLLEQIESKKESKRWWDTVLARYPDSQEAAQVRILRGRRAIKEGEDDHAALDWLRPIANRPDIHGATAVYWMGWAYTNLDQPDKALEHFLRAARATKADNPPLHRQAVLDSIVTFSLKYPNRSGLVVYRKLAANRGIYAGAIRKLESRARSLANHPVDFELVREMAGLDPDWGNNDRRVSYVYKAHVETEFRYLRASDVSWFAGVHRDHALIGPSQADVDEAYDDMIFDLCMRLHENWEKSPKKAQAAVVVDAWNTYLDHPRRQSHRVTALQNLARLHDLGQRPFEAAMAWSQLADTASGVSSLRAHREGLVRYLKQFENETDKRSPMAWQSLAGLMRHLRPLEKHLKPNAGAKFVYRVARAHHQAQAHDTAESLYRTLATRHPDSDQAIAGIQALLGLQNLKGDSKAFIATLEWLERAPAGKRPAVKQEIARLLPAVREKRVAERMAQARQRGPEATERLINETDDPAIRGRLQAGLVEQHANQGSLTAASEALTAALSGPQTGNDVFAAATTLSQQHFLRGQIEEGVSTLKQANGGVAPAEYAAYVRQWTDAMEGVGDYEPEQSPPWQTAQRDAQAYAKLLREPGHLPIQALVGGYGPVRDTLLGVAQVSSVEEAVSALYALVRLTHRLSERVEDWAPPAGLSPDQEDAFRSALAEHAAGIRNQAEAITDQCVDLVQSRQIMSTSALGCLGRPPNDMVRPRFQRLATENSARKRLLKNPGTPKDLAALAQSAAENGQTMLGLRIVGVGLTKDPNSGVLLRVQGEIYWKRGERAAAAQIWESAARAGDEIARDNTRRITNTLRRTNRANTSVSER